jgi:hypothetical protein
MNEDILKTKTDLDPSEYKKIFGDPFWRSQWQQSFNKTFQSEFFGGLSIKLK